MIRLVRFNICDLAILEVVVGADRKVCRFVEAIDPSHLEAYDLVKHPTEVEDTVIIMVNHIRDEGKVVDSIPKAQEPNELVADAYLG